VNILFVVPDPVYANSYFAFADQLAERGHTVQRLVAPPKQTFVNQVIEAKPELLVVFGVNGWLVDDLEMFIESKYDFGVIYFQPRSTNFPQNWIYDIPHGKHDFLDAITRVLKIQCNRPLAI
jgi:hypothetical protein